MTARELVTKLESMIISADKDLEVFVKMEGTLELVREVELQSSTEDYWFHEHQRRPSGNFITLE